MIKNAQRLGLSLDEIDELLKNDPESNEISAMAEQKLAEVDAQIAHLTLVRNALATYIRCPRSAPER